MNKLILLFFFILNWVVIPVVAQTNIQTAVDMLANDPILRQGGLSVAVIDLTTGKVLAKHRPEKSMIPASTLKVIITSIALEMLGNDFQFKTELAYDGTLTSEGILKGNLFIKGYGDPTLGSHHFKKVETYDLVIREWVEAIKAAGIKKIEGKIIGDASFFGTQVDGRTWLWEDLGNYYGAGAWGLNFHENLFLLELQQQSQLGDVPTIQSIQPNVPNLYLVNELTSAERGSGDNAYIFGIPYAYTRFIRGTIPIGKGPFTIKGAVPDPPFFAAYHLMMALEKAGIETSKAATSSFQLKQEGVLVRPQQIIHTYLSPVLADIIKETNLKSVNLYCEALLRLLGKKIKGVGTPAAGLEIVEDYLDRKQINHDGIFLEDASGLSSRNAVSADFLVRFMAAVYANPTIFKTIKASLPVAGKSGALAGMFRGTPAAGRIFAKSGGMNRVRSYTGYAQNAKGNWLAFAIIANDFKGKSSIMRRKMERLMLSFCQ